MNKFRLFGILSAALIIISGTVYLKVGDAALAPTLAASAVSILLMGIFSVLEARSKGEKGIASLIPASCFFVLSVAVFSAFVYVIIK